MVYTITIKDINGKPIPGGKLTFVKSGTVLTSISAGPDGVASLNDETDGGLLGNDVMITASATGFYDGGATGSQLLPDTDFLLQPKQNYLLYGVIGGGILALIATSRKKKGVNGFFDNIDPKVKTGALIVGGVGALYLLSKLTGGSSHSSDLPKSADNQLPGLAAQGVYPTITDVQAETLASGLRAAFDDCGTDEQAVYAVMRQLRNLADVYKLISVYGTRSYKGCFDGDYFSNHTFNLSEALANELGSSELSQVNNILSGNGITFQF